MRRRHFHLSGLILLLAIAVRAGAEPEAPIHVGDTKAAVDSALGAPRGPIGSDDRPTYIYSNAAVAFENGRVVGWKFQDHEPVASLRPALPRTNEAARPAGGGGTGLNTLLALPGIPEAAQPLPAAGRATVSAVSGKARQIDELMTLYFKCGLFRGAVLVAEEGAVIYKRAFGLADDDQRIPNTTDTQFGIGALTEAFTATLVLQLVNEGKLKLDGKITDYLPDFPKSTGDKITVQHLLTQTSGFPWPDVPAGEVCQSSDWNYRLLGMLVRKVTGKPFAEVLSARILEPLGLRSTGSADAEARGPRKAATSYSVLGAQGLGHGERVWWTPADSGMYSTVDDLWIWSQALDTEQLLSGPSRQLMFTPSALADGRTNRFGYGWELLVDATNNVRCARGKGVDAGFAACVEKWLDERHFIAVLSNQGRDFDAVEAPALGIRSILLGEAPDVRIAFPPARDLYPVKETSVARLTVAGKPSPDLSCLEGMKLKSLRLERTGVEDFQFLRGMPLEELSIDRGSAAPLSLDLLRGMPLRKLTLRHFKLRDLSVLTTMPLIDLDLSGTWIGDASILKGLKLGSLNIQGSGVTNLAPLVELPLAKLAVGQADVVDLSPLGEMAVEEVDIRKCPNLTDISPLKGLRLTALTLEDVAVRDLAPLQDMPLGALGLAGPLPDLSPLAHLPVKTLSLRDLIADLSPLEGLPVETLEISGEVGGLESLARIKSLRKITWRRSLAAGGADMTAYDFRRECGPLLRRAADLRQKFDAAGVKYTRLCATTEGTHLDISGAGTTNLAPLSGADLHSLDLSNAPVSDLSPLRAMHLQWLDLTGVQTVDLSPLQGMTSLQRVAGYPLSSLLVTDSDPAAVRDCAERIIAAWRGVPAMAALVQEASEALECVKRAGMIRMRHAAMGAAASASSTHRGAPGEGPPVSLVDGDLRTRWSSAYAEPQHVTLRFGKPFPLQRVRLHWETAAAAEYRVLASANGKKWTTVGSVTNTTAGPRVDEIDGKGASCAVLKLEFLKRLNPDWGFSLYEIEVPASSSP